MKRRSLLKSAALLPGAALAQTPPATAEPSFDISLTTPDAAGKALPQFFTPAQFAALVKLGDLLVPPFNKMPGAVEAGAAEFLAMYISQSSSEQQILYRNGLDHLNAAGKKPFAELTPEQCASILAPLQAPWTYVGSKDPFAQFLAAAKDDFLRATISSRPYAAARSGSNTGYYWLVAD